MGQQRFVGMGINTLRPLTVLIAPDLSACNHTSWAPGTTDPCYFFWVLSCYASQILAGLAKLAISFIALTLVSS